VRHKANDGVAYAIEHGLGTTSHCLELLMNLLTVSY